MTGPTQLAPAGWYADTSSGTEVQRYWDGTAWTFWILRDGVPTDMRGGVPAPVRTADTARPAAVARPAPASTAPSDPPEAGPTWGAAASTAAAASQLLQGGASWQVVVGPRLPAFPPLTVEGLAGAAALTPLGRILRPLRSPAIGLAVVSLFALGPALLSAPEGLDPLVAARAAVAVFAVVTAAVGPRLHGGARRLAVLGPAVFALVQVGALAATAVALLDGRIGLGAALPAIVGTLATVLVAGLAARRGRSR